MAQNPFGHWYVFGGTVGNVDPNAVDARGRKLAKPTYSLAHLRARARVYMALKEWDKALADAEEVVQRQLGTDGGMSLRTDELDASEELRNTIIELRTKSPSVILPDPAMESNDARQN